MKRIHSVLLVITIAALSGPTVALAAGGPPSAGAAATATVRLMQTNIGKILVTSSGETLYMFTKDAHNRDRCVKIRGCSAVWPVLKAGGRPIAGNGVARSTLSTIKLSSGSRQVTYDGHPLYTYSLSGGPGDTSYVGAREFGGNWYALNARGRAVK